MYGDNLNTPRLFGIRNSNRDFRNAQAWGKNQFNNAFPVALSCYMYERGLQPVFLTLDENFQLAHRKIGVEEIFGVVPSSPDLFFCFEVDYQPYQKMIVGTLPRIDLVTRNTKIDQSMRGLEVKLTALPDHGTAGLSDDKLGCEIVVRPDTIVYQALSIASSFQLQRQRLLEILAPFCSVIKDWREESTMVSNIDGFTDMIRQIIRSGVHIQKPLIIQPVWKTLGKSSQLAENCLDIFVWSDWALLRLFIDDLSRAASVTKIQRPARSIIWLAKMLYDFAREGRFNASTITNQLSYSTRTDKAFAIGGSRTNSYMKCAELTKPRITKTEIKNIILGGGQNFLSPERRFDAIIANTPDIFK